MRTVTCSIRGLTPYSQSGFFQTEKGEKETHEDFEKRAWREKMHVTEDGMVFIPPMAFKQALSDAARFLSIKIPNRGKTTYTKHFESGVLCIDPVVLNVDAKGIEGEWIHANADGKRGSGKRVKRCFPLIPPGWEADVNFYVNDDTITDDVFERVLLEAGNLIGVGRFRPINGGFYGRFVLENIEWHDEMAMAAD